MLKGQVKQKRRYCWASGECEMAWVGPHGHCGWCGHPWPAHLYVGQKFARYDAEGEVVSGDEGKPQLMCQGCADLFGEVSDVSG